MPALPRRTGDYWAKLDGSCGEQVEPIFVDPAKVKDMVALREKLKPHFGRADLAAEEVNTLFIALGKVDMASCLRAQWALCRLRFGFSDLSSCSSAMAADFSDLPVGAIACFNTLSQEVEKSQAVINSAGLQADMDKFIGRGDKMKLPSTSFAQLRREFTEGISECKALLENFVGKVAARLQLACNSLENQIPDYPAYCVTVFDTEVVQKELVKKNWSFFADQWLDLSKLFGVARSLPHNVAGKFEVIHESVVTQCERALASGRTFIAVVSTVTLILATLPSAPTHKRTSLITEHLEKSKTSNLPANLSEYLELELKKCRKWAK